MLNAVPIWAIAVGFAILVGICGEIGFRLGTRAKASLEESPFAVLQTAIFGLLALLLAFSFSVGIARYDARRVEVLREANSIGTTMLRTQLLDARAAPVMRGYLRSYVDARIAFASAGIDERARADAAYRTAALQAAMWRLARRAGSALQSVDERAVIYRVAQRRDRSKRRATGSSGRARARCRRGRAGIRHRLCSDFVRHRIRPHRAPWNTRDRLLRDHALARHRDDHGSG